MSSLPIAEYALSNNFQEGKAWTLSNPGLVATPVPASPSNSLYRRAGPEIEGSTNLRIMQYLRMREKEVTTHVNMPKNESIATERHNTLSSDKSRLGDNCQILAVRSDNCQIGQLSDRTYRG